MGGKKKGPRGYRSGKSPRELAGECQELLADFGADSVHVRFEDGEPAELAFVLDTPEAGKIPFRFEPDVEGVRRRLEDGPSVKRGPETVAWFQTKQLLEATLEFNANGLASVTRLLAGMAVGSDGKSVGDLLAERPEALLSDDRRLLGGDDENSR